MIRAAIGTNNIDCCARICHSPTAWGMQQTFGTGAAVKDAIDSGVQRSTLKSAYIEQAVRASDGGQIKVDDNILASLYSTGDKGAKVRSDIAKINRSLRARESSAGSGKKISTRPPWIRSRVSPEPTSSYSSVTPSS